MDDWTQAAFERLLAVARRDTHQSRHVADFILAWWNTDSLGGFDPASLFALDSRIAADIATVFTWLAGQGNAIYPTEYRAEIENLIAEWRPDVWARSQDAAL